MRASGLETDVVDASAVDPDPTRYGGVIVVASVHAGGYQRSVREWVRRSVSALRDANKAMIDPELQSKLNMSVQELDLSVRANNCLESAKIGTVRDLVKKTDGDLLKVRSFGKTSLREVKRKLADMGLSLGMDLDAAAAANAAAVSGAGLDDEDTEDEDVEETEDANA